MRCVNTTDKNGFVFQPQHNWLTNYIYLCMYTNIYIYIYIYIYIFFFWKLFIYIYRYLYIAYLMYMQGRTGSQRQSPLRFRAHCSFEASGWQLHPLRRQLRWTAQEDSFTTRSAPSTLSSTTDRASPATSSSSRACSAPSILSSTTTTASPATSTLGEDVTNFSWQPMFLPI